VHRYGIPTECHEEEIKFVLSAEKVSAWLENQGHEVKPSYTLAISRKKI
jgi:hypothetical protein